MWATRPKRVLRKRSTITMLFLATSIVSSRLSIEGKCGSGSVCAALRSAIVPRTVGRSERMLKRSSCVGLARREATATEINGHIPSYSR